MDKQLIKVEVNQNNEQSVSARELHEKLGIQKRFSAWWADQIERLNLKENYDYCTSRYTNANNQDFEDCIVSIDIAKHICMISGGEQAHVIREYFIAVERAWNSPEQVMARALQYAQNQLDTYKDKLLIAEKNSERTCPCC